MEQLGNNTIYRKSLIFLERRATTRFFFNKLRREKKFLRVWRVEMAPGSKFRPWRCKLIKNLA